MASSVQLKPEDAEGIDRLIASGRYASREAVIAEALSLVRQRDDWLAMVEEKVARGLDDIDAGRTYTVEEVRAHFRNRYANER